MNDILLPKFLNDSNSINWTQLNIFAKNNKSIISILDTKRYICYNVNFGENDWYNFDFGNIFKYDIKVVSFNGDNSKEIIYHKKFDIRNHKFNIALKSENNNEIKTWKFYLWLIQLKMNVKFNIIENEDFLSQDHGDYVEISKKAYEHFLNRSMNEIPDYSSLNIIESLFDVLEDNSDILNHPWIKDKNITN
jgi:hypothetical protein